MNEHKNKQGYPCFGRFGSLVKTQYRIYANFFPRHRIYLGKALVFPRALLPQVKARPELAQTGVYLLLGPRPDGEGDMIYVGEGDPIRPRLESHYAQKDFWTRAIGFTTATMRLNRRPRPQLPKRPRCSPARARACRPPATRPARAL